MLYVFNSFLSIKLDQLEIGMSFGSIFTCNFHATYPYLIYIIDDISVVTIDGSCHDNTITTTAMILHWCHLVDKIVRRYAHV